MKEKEIVHRLIYTLVMFLFNDLYTLYIMIIHFTSIFITLVIPLLHIGKFVPDLGRTRGTVKQGLMNVRTYFEKSIIVSR